MATREVVDHGGLEPLRRERGYPSQRQAEVRLVRKDAFGHDAINLDLHSGDGRLVFSMRDNDWVVTPELDDIECPPSGHSLRIRSKSHDLSLDIGFSNKTVEEIVEFACADDFVREPERPALPDGLERPSESSRREKWGQQVREYLAERIGSEEITTCMVGFKIAYPVALKLTPKKLEARLGQGKFEFSGCLMGDVTVLKLQESM